MNLISPAIKVASAFTMGGAASAVAGLLLARHLSTQEFGHFSLIMAVTTFAVSLGPLSLDSIVLRRQLGATTSLLRSSMISGLAAGVLTAAMSWYVYGIDFGFLMFLTLAIAAGSVTRVGASVYQSEQRYNWSLWLIQSQNITLILGAILAGIFASVSEPAIFAAYAVHWAITAIVCWLALWASQGIKTDTAFDSAWGERTQLFGHLVTIQLFAALDRLLIPKLLDIESLATFGVLAVLIIAPFKMFEIGMGYTLVPGLRNATSKQERVKLILREGRTAFVVVIIATISAFAIAPWVKDLILGDKYQLGTTLIAAAVLAGALKVFAMFASSIVTSLGSQGQLGQLNYGSWIALLISVLCAWLGSRWGLAGLVAGFSVGSLARIAVASLIARSVLAESREAPSLLAENT